MSNRTLIHIGGIEYYQFRGDEDEDEAKYDNEDDDEDEFSR